MKRRVKISRLRSGDRAVCEGCGLRGEATRERVRQHVAQTGHIAHYVIEDITTYRPLEQP